MSSEESGEGFELWCGGLRLSSRRALSEEERSDLRRRALPELQRARVLEWVLTSAAILTPVCVGGVLIGGRPQSAMDALTLAFAGAAVALIIGGILGAAVEVLFGRTVAARLLLGSAGVLALAGGPWSTNGHPWIHSAGTVAFVGLLFIGNATLVLRGLEGRSTVRLLRRALEDVAEGEVLVFEAAAPTHGPERIQDEAEPSWRRVEVLGRSRLALSADGQSFEGWQAMPVARLASPGLLALPSEPSGVRRRGLTPQEREELIRLRAALRRGLLPRTLAMAYMSAIGVRFVEMVSERRLVPGLSPVGWGIVVLLAIAAFARALSRLRALSVDLEGGVVVSAPSVDPASASEALPRSGLPWVERGRPAPWRESA
jgi:hypothetical protein